MPLKLSLLTLALTLPVFAELPPIIDRQLLFGDPEITAAQISPDGSKLAFIKPLDGTRNVWVKSAAEPFSNAKPVTALTKRPVAGYFWSRDGKYILFAQDDGGDENFNVFAVNPADPVKPGDKTPPAKNLTDLKGVRALIYHVSRIDPDLMFIGLNDRDKAWHDLYKLKISTGERTLLRKNTDRIAEWVFDDKDQLRLAARVAPSGDQETLRIDADKLTPIYTCSVFEECGVLQFQKDGKHVYFITSKGDTDLSRLTLLDVDSGKDQMVESDPQGRVDFGGADFSEATQELVGTSYTDEKTRHYWHDKGFESDMKWLQSKFPGKQVNRGSHTLDETIWLVSVNADTEPGESYLFDRKTKKLTFQYRIYDKLDRSALAEMKPVRYKSSDGLEIPAYLTLPKGIPSKNLPVVVFPHGGPWARDNWGFNRFHQFLANRGYAVLSMNFRGSTGYGKKFLNAGNNEWGQKMQDDITWGVKYLIAEGIADPKRVGISGGSYGGYATLAGVTFTPDVYAAAVAIVAPSNLITLLDSIPPYWESVRAIFRVRMGDVSTPAGRDQLTRQSPLNSADKIKTPLMVVQGANDPRVNRAESDRIVIALRDRNYPVKYLVAPDEGHGFAKPLNNLAMTTAMERFFEVYLHGRSQKDVTDDVAKKLDELTVDPQKVVLAKPVSTSSSVLKPVRSLPAGTYVYNATMEMGGNKMNLGMQTEIKPDTAGWSVVEKMKTPMGDATDSSLLDKDSLAVRKRSVSQGPVAIDLTATDTNISGTVNMGGSPQQVNSETGGPLFAESAAGFVLATLPLADGYSATFQNFDLQKLKAKAMQMQVIGSESVTVPAGTFDAFKLSVKPGDGSPGDVTYWIDKASYKPVKMQASLPQMGGATMTVELNK